MSWHVFNCKDELFPSELNLLQTMHLVLGTKLCSSGKRSSNLWEEWVTGKILPWSEGQSWGPEGTWSSLQGYRDSEGRKRCCQERENRSYHPERPSAKGILSSPSGIASDAFNDAFFFLSLVRSVTCKTLKVWAPWESSLFSLSHSKIQTCMYVLQDILTKILVWNKGSYALY